MSATRNKSGKPEYSTCFRRRRIFRLSCCRYSLSRESNVVLRRLLFTKTSYGTFLERDIVVFRHTSLRILDPKDESNEQREREYNVSSHVVSPAERVTKWVNLPWTACTMQILALYVDKPLRRDGDSSGLLCGCSEDSISTTCNALSS